MAYLAKVVRLLINNAVSYRQENKSFGQPLDGHTAREFDAGAIMLRIRKTLLIT
jgi:hypothetical protein